MKKAHKAFVTQAIALRKAIKTETLAIADLEADIAAGNERIRAAQSELSELEAEAAEGGLSSADLRQYVDEKLS